MKSPLNWSKVLVTFFALCVIVLSFAGPANASGTHSSTATCNLSTNWKVSMSASWQNRNEHNTEGYLNYVVVSTPAPLNEVAIDVVHASGPNTPIRDIDPFGPSSTVYRYDPNETAVEVLVRAYGGVNNVTCFNFMTPND